VNLIDAFDRVSAHAAHLGAMIATVIGDNVRGPLRLVGKIIDDFGKTRRGRQVLKAAWFYARHTTEWREARRIRR
jgi:hypothetical protein